MDHCLNAFASFIIGVSSMQPRDLNKVLCQQPQEVESRRRERHAERQKVKERRCSSDDSSLDQRRQVQRKMIEREAEIARTT